MRYISTLLLFQLITVSSFSQDSLHKISILAYGGWLDNIAKRGPKYETDVSVFRHFHRHYRTYIKLDFVEVFKTKNVAALQYYTKERNMFEMPPREVFEAKIKPPKYTITYEEAIALAFSADN